VDPAIGEWWTRFQHADDAERKVLLTEEGEPAKRKRRRRRRRPSAEPENEAERS
jgi:poly(A) polymerase